MPDPHAYPVRTAAQLTSLLQAYRKASGLTQTEVARRLGVTQQTLSALERNAARASAERLFDLLAILGVQVVLRQEASVQEAPVQDAATAPPPAGPSW